MTSGQQDDEARATRTGWEAPGQQPHSAPPQWQPPQQPSGYPPAPPRHPDALVALVLGGVSVMLFPFVGPVAWYLGAKATREIDDQPGRWSGDDLAKIGLVLGIIGTVLCAVAVLFIIMFVGMFSSMLSVFP